jgi:adenylate cyclase
MIMRLLKDRNFLVNLLTLVMLVLAILIIRSEPDILQAVRNITFDSYQRFKPRTPSPTPVRIVDIDDASLKEFGQWPWPRTRIAKLVERLTEMGAAAIAFDVVFAEPDRTAASEIIRQLDEIEWPDRDKLQPILESLPDNDEVFARAIGTGPVVLGFFSLDPSTNSLLPNTMPKALGSFSIVGDDPKPALLEIKNSISSLPILQEAASGMGLATPSPKRDDIIREVPSYVHDGKSIYPALSLEALRVAQGASTFIIKTNHSSGEFDTGDLAVTNTKIGDYAFPVTANGGFNVYFAHEQPERYLPAHEVMTASIEEMRPNIEGYIIFVGTSAVGLEDLRISALGETIPGVSVHAQVIDQILTETFLLRPDWAQGAEIYLTAIICILIVAILPFFGAVASAFIGAVLASVTLAVSWYAFSQKGILIDPVFPSVVAASIFLMTTILRFAISEREKRFVRSAFQQYLAPDLLSELEKNPDSLKLGGEIRDLTLMFMDIRGFTPISEKLPPQELVGFLNKLLSPLSDIIQNNEGAIDKYIGDCIMAFWNAPLDVADHPRKAATAGLKMLECIKELNANDSFDFKSGPHDLGDVGIGIGINSGDGCVGNMGSLTRFDYSVVGDTVNFASRIEGASKDVGWPLLISHDTAERCEGFAILEAGLADLKGKSEAASLYALIGDEEFAKSEYFVKLKNLHETLISDLKISGWEHSGAKFLSNLEKCRQHASEEMTGFYRNIERYNNLIAA